MVIAHPHPVVNHAADEILRGQPALRKGRNNVVAILESDVLRNGNRRLVNKISGMLWNTAIRNCYRCENRYARGRPAYPIQNNGLKGVRRTPLDAIIFACQRRAIR